MFNENPSLSNLINGLELEESLFDSEASSNHKAHLTTRFLKSVRMVDSLQR